MLKDLYHLHLARVTLETTTPLSIQSGQADLNYDTTLTRDANGLPGIPPTASRGVLRHLYHAECGEENCQQLFGYGKQDATDKDDEGQISRLQVSWGAIHNQHDQPVEGLLINPLQDQLLCDLVHSQPMKRERVSLNERGCATDTGKYDLTAVPTGTRFTLELKFWSQQAEDTDWQRLLQLLSHPAFRLGSNTRSGLGALKVNAIFKRSFDMRDPDDAAAWRNLPRGLAQRQGLRQGGAEAKVADPLTVILSLTAEDFLRVGGGEVPLKHHGAQTPPRLLQMAEQKVEWNDGGGKLSEKRYALLPASAFKGAIAHRTVYHYNRLTGQFSDHMTDQAARTAATLGNDARTCLFGFANDETTGGMAGHILMDDQYLDVQDINVVQLHHNRLDRFTGGVMAGALYSEEVLYRPAFKITLTLLNPDQIPALVRTAFHAALTDLTEGMLPLGAGGSRGLGACSGDMDWSDHGVWLTADTTTMEQGAQ